MPGIHDTFRDEEVGGTIIGAMGFSGRVFYDGRAQGQRVFAETMDSLYEMLNARIKEIQTESGDMFHIIYPERIKWEFRIDT